MDYHLLVDIEVLDFIATLKPAQRRRLMSHFRRIQSYPEYHAEYVERDHVGRRIDVCIFDGFAIHYREDVTDRHVKVR